MDLYQQNIMDYYKHPRCQGVLAAATHRGEVANPLCGDRLELQLALAGDTIAAAQWQGEGCVLSLVAADMLAEGLQGKSLAQLTQLDQRWLLTKLGVNPSPSRMKCALLALEALARALPKP